MASIRSGIGENMEDRYLYRAKRLDNGEWVQGYLVYFHCMNCGQKFDWSDEE